MHEVSVASRAFRVNRKAPGQTGRGYEAAKGAAGKGKGVVRKEDDGHGLPILTPRPGQ